MYLNWNKMKDLMPFSLLAFFPSSPLLPIYHFLPWVTRLTESSFSFFNLFSSWTHITESSLIDHFLYMCFSWSYSLGKKLNMKVIRDLLEKLNFEDLSWATISLKSHNVLKHNLEMLHFIIESFLIRVKAKTLSDLIIWLLVTL